MGTTNWLAPILAMTLLAQVTPAFSDASDGQNVQDAPALRRVEVTTLEQFDWFIEGRKRTTWQMRDRSAEFGPDIAGRTLEQNADEYIFTPQADAELTALRARAGEQSAAGDQAGLAASLHAATDFATRMLAQLTYLGQWHVMSAGVSAQEVALKPVLEKSPEAERSQARARIDQSLQEMRKLLPEAMNAENPGAVATDRKLATYDALFAAYNEERVRLVPFAKEWDRAHGIAPLSRTRSAPCAPPFPQPSGTKEASVDKSSTTMPDFPVDARRFGFEGTVQLRAHVSATGCPERIEIYRSVGYEPLDAEALRWAEGIRFHPAVVNGKPVDRYNVFAVTFKLTD